MADLHKVRELGLDEDTTLAILERLKHISQLYRSGKPLFPRRLLEDLNRQIDDGKEEVYISDFDDVPQVYSLKVPSWCTEFANTYRIRYQSIHSLGCVPPYDPERVLCKCTPVAIDYVDTSGPGESTLEAIGGAFFKQRQIWLESLGHRNLEHHLSTLRTTANIRKIVCFGLGSLGRLSGDCYTRTHTQHAAVETIAASLVRRGLSGSQEIKCYAQDPVYDEVDHEFLRSIGITPLEDPKGFLEVDEHTLVFSVSPDVPVKQIVTDLHWPGAMIWDTVTPSEKRKSWAKYKENDGTIFWITPFTTDPDSGRVRRMIKHYAHAQLEDSDGFFGDLTIYMKCEE
ncbi:unnamed protein product [Aspergillus oryzae RIB40]|uniref:DNA, SC010 n=1 Tax=Aspergillus oryzae (strain ATCC 42149 / RIB 40) TaxID=510516 RepID=Q2TXK8_ASPOR|nr:unnamed protein product [Aspergillus oryzae RIB40]BAE66015.1 unnamed protein product [Aspergillus oryzae RIB40]